MAEIQQTGSSALSYTFTPVVACKLKSVEFHLSAAGGTATEYFTATKDDATNAVYDVVFIKEDMETASDVVSLDEHELKAGDKIVFAYTNTTSATWGLTIKYET